jgi:hypothetical protein
VLDCCHVTNGGIQTIVQSMTRLEKLDMSDNAITSSGVAYIAALTCLTRLKSQPHILMKMGDADTESALLSDPLAVGHI